MHKTLSEVCSGSTFSDTAEYLTTTWFQLYWRRLAFIRILKQGKGILCMMKGLPMDLLLSSSFFLPYLKRQALWLSHINLFFIASALSILLLDDLSLSDNPFPYKANNAKWDITIDHHFYTKESNNVY